MASLEIKCSYRWIDEDADGQECFSCGDRCFLFPVKKIEMLVGKSIYDTDVTICKSCFDRYVI